MASTTGALYQPHEEQDPPADVIIWQPRQPSRWEAFMWWVRLEFRHINWYHVALKICAYSYIFFWIWLIWRVLQIPRPSANGNGELGRGDEAGIQNYFSNYVGFSECGVKGVDLYAPQTSATPSASTSDGFSKQYQFCPTRAHLLEAMSTGGRIGFDAPYMARGCNYRWFDIAQVCMILERFDGVIFVSDESLLSVYKGLNILLRQNLATGALQSWSMDAAKKADCRCDHQFQNRACSGKSITASEQILQNAPTTYACQSRVPHAFLTVDSPNPFSATTIASFHKLAPKAPPSNYKHIPIVFALSPYTAAVPAYGAEALATVVDLAKSTRRKIDILALGPTAPGHTEIKNRKNNQQVWDYHHVLAHAVRMHDKDNSANTAQGDRRTRQNVGVEMLGMYNLTVQANSWDGRHFGQKIAITQAMMVLNWLARLNTT